MLKVLKKSTILLSSRAWPGTVHQEMMNCLRFVFIIHVHGMKRWYSVTTGIRLWMDGYLVWYISFRMISEKQLNKSNSVHVVTSRNLAVWLHCALAEVQCIVIGPLCGWVGGCGSVTTITWNCVQWSSPNWVCK